MYAINSIAEELSQHSQPGGEVHSTVGREWESYARSTLKNEPVDVGCWAIQSFPKSERGTDKPSCAGIVWPEQGGQSLSWCVFLWHGLIGVLLQRWDDKCKPTAYVSQPFSLTWSMWEVQTLYYLQIFHSSDWPQSYKVGKGRIENPTDCL